jgi:hypothetical protein
MVGPKTRYIARPQSIKAAAKPPSLGRHIGKTRRAGISGETIDFCRPGRQSPRILKLGIRSKLFLVSLGLIEGLMKR